MNILVTGATGFIGKALVNGCLNENHSVIAATRRQTSELPSSVSQVKILSLDSNNDWTLALQDAEVVIHLAGLAHTSYTNDEYRHINQAATLNLASQAAKKGVRRFIFLSSIGVNGNENRSPFKETDTPSPVENYAISKYEAEKGLLKIANKTNMEVVIIRPPLVYGANAPGNFASLIKWVKIGIPLPLGAVHNKRSFVALDNLVNFIIHCIEHSKAANEIFLISDGEDVSTTQFLHKIANALGKSIWLIPVPVILMIVTANFLGKGGVARRLFSSLQIDNSKARNLLNWKSVVTMDEQMRKTIDSDS